MNESQPSQFNQNHAERKLVPFSEKHEVLRNKLKDFESLLSDEYFKKVNEDIYAFCKNLEEKYSDFSRHQIYHALIGSGMDSSIDIVDDFPGEDSVEKFIENLVQKYEAPDKV